jgi:hypothetical protein
MHRIIDTKPKISPCSPKASNSQVFIPGQGKVPCDQSRQLVPFAKAFQTNLKVLGWLLCEQFTGDGNQCGDEQR